MVGVIRNLGHLLTFKVFKLGRPENTPGNNFPCCEQYVRSRVSRFGNRNRGISVSLLVVSFSVVKLVMSANESSILEKSPLLKSRYFRRGKY